MKTRGKCQPDCSAHGPFCGDAVVHRPGRAVRLDPGLLLDLNTSKQYDTTYPGPGVAAATCTVAGPFPLPPHDVCTAGEKLGQACEERTMKVCAADSYGCDTFWALPCFDSVRTCRGRTCGK